jgi:hypothetical protein
VGAELNNPQRAKEHASTTIAVCRSNSAIDFVIVHAVDETRHATPCSIEYAPVGRLQF